MQQRSVRHRRSIASRFLIASAGLVATFSALTACERNPTIPERLGDSEFWSLSAGMSEPGGYFHSDNLVSNELGFQYVIRDLLAAVGSGSVYVGVGPDQNFTYVAALRPRIAFVVDIRRQNRSST